MGVVDRLVLRDEQWKRISPYILGDDRTRGSSGRDNRMFVEAVLWIVRTGSPWRDLPDMFGGWNSVFRRFGRWCPKGIWWRMFAVMPDNPDFEALIVGSTIIRAHQHAADAKKGLHAGIVMADTAYDSDRLRTLIAEKGAVAVIPNTPSPAKKYPLDKQLYAQRHLVECCFSRLKQVRSVATRFEKTARNYLAVVTIAAIALWIR